MVSLNTKFTQLNMRRTTPAQKLLLLWVIFSAMLYSVNAQALTVTAERQIIPINETLRLEIIDNTGAELGNIDLSAIEENFTIVNQSSQTSFSMVNGRTESRKSLVLLLAPQKLGSVLIPPLSLGQQKSKPIKIKVIKALPLASELKDQSVIVESEVDNNEVLIGSQLIYTFRVIYRVQLNNAEIDGIELDNADITALEDKNYTRSINGKNYNVTEKRYAIFFNEAGDITIPSQSLIAVLPSSQRRTFGFDPFARGKELRLESKAIDIKVLAAPANATTNAISNNGANKGANNGHTNAAGNLLAAQHIQLTEEWPAAQQEIRVAEPITRSISIIARGLPAELLPTIVPENIDGINSYPEKPELLNQEFIHGIASKRTETIAMVPTKAGTFTLPAIELHWWSTLNNRKEVATLPAKTITVLPAAQSQSNNNAVANAPASLEPATINNKQTDNAAENIALEAASPAQSINNNAGTNNKFWMPIALFAMIGWLITLCILFYKPRKLVETNSSNADKGSSNTIKALQKTLEAACKNNDASEAKRLLNTWLAAINSANPHAYKAASPDFDRAVDTLNQYLFSESSVSGKQAPNWDGSDLGNAIKNVAKANQSEKRSKAGHSSTLKPLYPNA